MRIAEIIHNAATRLDAESIDDARLEAEVLLAYVLRADRAHLLARMADDADAEASARFEVLLARRLAREPLAYIVGHREFYGIEVECAPGALIPRPETEMLVELALDEVRRRGDALRIVDVGTGSGAIALAIAANAPGVRVTAIDASEAALAVARRSVERTGVADRVELRAGDLLEEQGVFDVIVANLPYVSAAEWELVQPEIREYEPREALVGGASGTEAVERLLREAPPHLAPGGLLAAEIGATQGARLLAVARECFPDAHVCVIKDLAGLDRVLEIRRRGG
jgi:release factor glutamine methyltransferase